MAIPTQVEALRAETPANDDDGDDGGDEGGGGRRRFGQHAARHGLVSLLGADPGAGAHLKIYLFFL